MIEQICTCTIEYQEHMVEHQPRITRHKGQCTFASPSLLVTFRRDGVLVVVHGEFVESKTTIRSALNTSNISVHTTYLVT